MTNKAKNNRYSRQVLFSPIGQMGQAHLSKSHVLLVGCGALGTGIADGLVRAGVGQLSIVDRDFVEESNLQRQTLFSEKDAKNKLPKAIAAQARLLAINSSVKVIPYVEDATVDFFEQNSQGVDLILDATDNFETRFIINDICMKYHIPWVYGACLGSYGTSFTIIPGETPCFNCLVKVVPLGDATCDTVGIIAPAVQMVVAYQTAEALKILSGNRSAVRQKIVSFDLWENMQTGIDISKMKNKACLSCGENPTYPYLSFKNRTKVAILCGRQAVQIRPPQSELDLDEVAQRLNAKKLNDYLIFFVSGDKSMTLFKDGRAIIQGTNDIREAKNFYHRYLG